MRTYKRLLVPAKVLVLVVAILSCSGNTKSVCNEDVIAKKVDSVMSLLTLGEKVAMLHGNSKFHAGGIERLNIPEWRLTDGPHGIREEMALHVWKTAGRTDDSSTYFPTGTALAATWNPKLARRTGECLAMEARARNKDVLLGPGVNIHRTPLCGRNFEYLTEDPLLNTRISVEYIHGVQSKDVAACIKHFAVNNQEYQRDTIDVNVDERALREIYMPAFKAAVQEANVYTIMGAYNKFRKVYSCENNYLLNELLRDEWGFKGVVISDWDATHSTVDAANNGLDLEMGTEGKDYKNWYFADPLIEAVNAGTVKQETVDAKVRAILTVMYKTNMFNPNRNKGAYNVPEHYQAAYKTASEAIVLLKNDNKLLPLKASEIKSIAVIGDNATRKNSEGGYSSGVKAKREVTPLQGLKNKLPKEVEINYALGYKKIPFEKELERAANKIIDEKLIEEAVKAAKKSDVAVIFGGLNHDFDTELSDKPDMFLPYGQDELLKAVLEANPNTIVVFLAGSPVDMRQFHEQASTIVWGWLNGSEGGNAMADMLLGAVNPSGKMPFTLPVKLEDSPAHNVGEYPGENYKVVYNEGVLVGYRWFDTKGIKPLYAFGHGLSYTSFELSNLKLNKDVFNQEDKIEVTIQVENTGDRAGAETVQLYTHDVEASVPMPKKELRTFRKVFLQPGEKKDVKLSLDASNLSFYDVEGSAWKLEPGEFKVLIGNASDNIVLEKPFMVE